MMTDTAEQPRRSARYPSKARTTRGKKWGFTALGVLAGIGLGFVMYQQFGPAEIEYEVVAFNVVDDDTLDIKLSVTRQDPSQEAVCIVRARSRDGSETGRREVLIPASDSSTVVLDSTVKTSQRPGMGDGYGCSFNVPEYLRAP